MGTIMPALFGRLMIAGRNCCRINRLATPHSSHEYYPVNTLITRRLFFNISSQLKSKQSNFNQVIRRRCTGPTQSNTGADGANAGPKKLSLFQKFKTMYKDYWYVLVPVHVVTSVGWFGAFYQVSTSGVDVGHYLRQIGINEKIIKGITDSGMGHVAVAWALYKVATPARYAVTLGGTTLSINMLRNMGYIKPAKELMAKGRDKMKSLKDKQLPKN